MKQHANENNPSLPSINQDPAQVRRKQLEEYKKAKQAKKESLLENKNKRLTDAKAGKRTCHSIAHLPSQVKKIKAGLGPVQFPLEEIIPNSQNDDSKMIGDVLELDKPSLMEGGPKIFENHNPADLITTGTDDNAHTDKHCAALPNGSSENHSTIYLSSRIDWSKPVFLKLANGICHPIYKRPRLLFPLWLVRIAIERDNNIHLAKLMLEINQFYRLGTQLYNEIAMLEKSIIQPLPLPTTPEHRVKEEKEDTLPNTPSTPEMPKISHLEPSTPEMNDPETIRLRAEVEEVICRTPILKDPISSELLHRALPALQATTDLLTRKSFTAHKKHCSINKNEGESRGGSSYLYALVTPSKRLRDLLQTESVVSPVRRSQRLLSRRKSAEGKESLFETIDDVPQLEEKGFVPNPCIRNTREDTLLTIPSKKHEKDLGILPPPDPQ